MNTGKDTRTAILDAAQDMVQRQSISGVSFQELADRIGIKKGSMYYHFESKSALAAAMLERARLALKASFERGHSKTAVQQLDYYLNIYSEFIGAGQRMCPAGAFAGVWERQSSPVKEQVNKLITTQLQGIKNIISKGLKSGEFNAHGLSLDDLALWVVSNLQGALLTGRIMGNKKSFDSSAKTIRKFLYQT